jgi:hypothetical protein
MHTFVTAPCLECLFGDSIKPLPTFWAGVPPAREASARSKVRSLHLPLIAFFRGNVKAQPVKLVWDDVV